MFSALEWGRRVEISSFFFFFLFDSHSHWLILIIYLISYLQRFNCLITCPKRITSVISFKADLDYPFRHRVLIVQSSVQLRLSLVKGSIGEEVTHYLSYLSYKDKRLSLGSLWILPGSKTDSGRFLSLCLSLI